MLMKKYLSFACVSAIALAGVCSFTACSSEEEVVTAAAVEDNPTYDPATGLVKSQFVLNIASNAQTRSGATTVQAGGENFRGIDNTVLFAFKTSGKGFIDATDATTVPSGVAAGAAASTTAAADPAVWSSTSSIQTVRISPCQAAHFLKHHQPN